MQAIGFTGGKSLDDATAFVRFTCEVPQPAGHDLRIAVHAVSVNPVDTKVRAGIKTAQQPPRILGWDAAGVVESVGDGVTLFKPGDRVFYAGDINRPGSNATHQLVDERIVGRVPELADHPGWQGVTFHHTLNMVTGTVGPGQEFAIYSTHSFVLSLAMNRLVEAREGPGADYWTMVREDVLEPIGIPHLPISRSFDGDGWPGTPIMG